MTDTVSVARPPRPAAPAARVTIVTQTRIRSGQEVAFATWQERIGASVARFPGFIEQSVMQTNNFLAPANRYSALRTIADCPRSGKPEVVSPKW